MDGGGSTRALLASTLRKVSIPSTRFLRLGADVGQLDEQAPPGDPTYSLSLHELDPFLSLFMGKSKLSEDLMK